MPSPVRRNTSVRGAVAAVQARIASRPWVASIGAENAAPPEQNGATTLHVRVTDADAAESQLLRLALDDPQTTVIEFGRTKQNLEAIFLQIVEGGDGGDKAAGRQDDKMTR